jgi:hypothetical protein
MVTLDQAAALALALPEVVEGERFRRRTWFVGKKAFAWDRPFSKADLTRFGDETPPSGEILAISTADLSEKEAILTQYAGPVFTIEHFDGYAAVLIQLSKVTKPVLRELLQDAWLAVAPKTLAKQHFGPR